MADRKGMAMKAWMAALAAGGVGACGAVASAQQDASGMQVVEGGTVDENPMSAPLRLVPLDMRLPTGFERVYRVEGQTGDLFARQDGGLTAVFPRSVYNFGPAGVTTPVPAGTTWLIGETPAWYANRNGLLTTEAAQDGAAPAFNPLRVDLRADSPGSERRYRNGPVAAVDLVATWPIEAAAPQSVPEGDVDALLAATEPAGEPGVAPWGSDAERGRLVLALLEERASDED